MGDSIQKKDSRSPLGSILISQIAAPFTNQEESTTDQIRTNGKFLPVAIGQKLDRDLFHGPALAPQGMQPVSDQMWNRTIPLRNDAGSQLSSTMNYNLHSSSQIGLNPANTQLFGDPQTYRYMMKETRRRRPRRKWEEIERKYKCDFNGTCEKAYGTLNHLNAHVALQQHGQKRLPQDFKPSFYKDGRSIGRGSATSST